MQTLKGSRIFLEYPQFILAILLNSEKQVTVAYVEVNYSRFA